MSRGNLLLEFFSEEIPARMQLNSEIQLENLFVKSLTQRDIALRKLNKALQISKDLRKIIENGKTQ